MWTSTVLRLDLNPHCTFVCNLLDSRYQTSLRLIICAMVLQVQFVKVTGQQCVGFLWKKKQRMSVNVFRVDNGFHLFQLKYHGHYEEHPGTLPQRREC